MAPSAPSTRRPRRDRAGSTQAGQEQHHVEAERLPDADRGERGSTSAGFFSQSLLGKAQARQHAVDRADARMEQELPHRRHRDQRRGHGQEIGGAVEAARPCRPRSAAPTPGRGRPTPARRWRHRAACCRASAGTRGRRPARRSFEADEAEVGAPNSQSVKRQHERRASVRSSRSNSRQRSPGRRAPRRRAPRAAPRRRAGARRDRGASARPCAAAARASRRRATPPPLRIEHSSARRSRPQRDRCAPTRHRRAIAGDATARRSAMPRPSTSTCRSARSRDSRAGGPCRAMPPARRPAPAQRLGPHADGSAVPAGAHLRRQRARRGRSIAAVAAHAAGSTLISGLPMNRATSQVGGLGRRSRRGGADLQELAAHHHGDAVGHRHRLDLVVRDVDEGRAEPAMQLGDLGAHVHAQLGVEVGQRLVHQEDAAGGAPWRGRARRAGAGRRRAAPACAREVRDLQPRATARTSAGDRAAVLGAAPGSRRPSSGRRCHARQPAHHQRQRDVLGAPSCSG